MPLQRRINDGKFNKTWLADKLDVLPQHITNWFRRGIPGRRLQDVAALLDLSTDEYMQEAGLRSKHAKPRQGKISTAAILKDFEALPEGLQAYIERKTSELRELYETLPAWLRDKLVPPKDPDSYREWERDIEALVSRFKKDDK